MYTVEVLSGTGEGSEGHDQQHWAVWNLRGGGARSAAHIGRRLSRGDTRCHCHRKRGIGILCSDSCRDSGRCFGHLDDDGDSIAQMSSRPARYRARPNLRSAAHPTRHDASVEDQQPDPQERRRELQLWQYRPGLAGPARIPGDTDEGEYTSPDIYDRLSSTEFFGFTGSAEGTITGQEIRLALNGSLTYWGQGGGWLVWSLPHNGPQRHASGGEA